MSTTQTFKYKHTWEAAAAGDLKELQKMHKAGYPLHGFDNFLTKFNTTDVAAENGHLDCLRYAYENGCPWDRDLTTKASARKGHLDCLKYAHENGCPWDSDTIKYAAQYGHLDCLKYAHENGCPWGDVIGVIYSLVTSAAAKNGHLDCLKYAHENGCPWNYDTTSNAASNGHLDCLKYAHENGCPWNHQDTLKNAAENGHFDCLRYAFENGCTYYKKDKYTVKIIDQMKIEIQQGRLKAKMLLKNTIPEDILKHILIPYI